MINLDVPGAQVRILFRVLRALNALARMFGKEMVPEPPKQSLRDNLKKGVLKNSYSLKQPAGAADKPWTLLVNQFNCIKSAGCALSD